MWALPKSSIFSFKAVPLAVTIALLLPSIVDWAHVIAASSTLSPACTISAPLYIYLAFQGVWLYICFSVTFNIV